MSDVQGALLILGSIVIIIMIFHNWAQLKKQNKREGRANKSNQTILNDENDPLFNNVSENLHTSGLTGGNTLNENFVGSEKIIISNLPDEVSREVETIASITTKVLCEGLSHLALDKLSSVKGTQIYIRKDNDIWATGAAIDSSVSFNQILIVLLLADRKGALSEEDVNIFTSYVNSVNDNVDGSLFWLANPDIKEQSDILNDFRKEVDRSLIIKVFPKSDSSFHAAPLIEFFEQPTIQINKNLYHELIADVNTNVICRISNLSQKPLEIKQDSFLQGIIFKMDVPNTKLITRSFNEMIGVIREFNSKLNAVMVDASNKELNDDQISNIYIYLKGIEKKLNGKKMPPGGNLAKKLFS